MKTRLTFIFILSLVSAMAAVAIPIVFPTTDRITAANLSTLPDLDVAYIGRTPRYVYTAVKNQPAPGDMVTFEGHVANRGGQATSQFVYAWLIDNITVLSGTHSTLAPGAMITMTLSWVWQSGTHTVTLQLDPANSIAEVSEQNNLVADRTNALAVGFWVEQSVYDWFNAHQVELGLGSVSWDDWAQRQLQRWNQMFAEAVHPLTPQGITDRVRLDKVMILPDGTWPDCSNTFWPEDQTVDLVWGFASELVGVHSGHSCGEFNFYTNHPEFQNFELPLLHEMSHARYLVDLYGLNVYMNSAYLANAVNGTSSTLIVDRNVETDVNFSTPAYLAVGGELLICQSKTGNTFTNCSRGAEGTTPRAHVTGTLVNLAAVRLQDGQGNLVLGSPALPALGWDDHLYYNRYPDDLMNLGPIYEPHSAYAWNRIAGQRPVCGNYNAPCNIGEYLNDIPAHNVLALRDSYGLPLRGASVAVHRARPLPVWYGKAYLNTPDAVYVSDGQGHVDLGPSPFSGGSSIVHTYGHSNAVLLVSISVGDDVNYRFLEVTEANEAYWSGNHDTGTYVIATTLSAGPPAAQIFLPVVARNYPRPLPLSPLLKLDFENTFVGAEGEVGTASGPTFVAGRDGLGVLFDNSDTLYYSTDDNLMLEQGSIEFWLKPAWPGSDQQEYVFLEVGNTWFNRLRIMKDGANNFRFMVWSADTEYGVACNVNSWAANEWHLVRTSWQNNTIKLYLDGAACDTNSAIAMPSGLASRIYIGSTSQGTAQAQAVIDGFVIRAQP